MRQRLRELELRSNALERRAQPPLLGFDGFTDPAGNPVIAVRPQPPAGVGILCKYDASLNVLDGVAQDPWEKNTTSPLRVYDGPPLLERDTGQQILGVNKLGPISDGKWVIVVPCGANPNNYATATECG